MNKKKPTGSGRQPGTQNRVNADIKKAFTTLLKANMDNLNTWLNETAKENPAKAMELVLKMSEFLLPKLKQQEYIKEIDQPMPMIKFTYDK